LRGSFHFVWNINKCPRVFSSNKYKI
jgi:hypothetical protein